MKDFVPSSPEPLSDEDTATTREGAGMNRREFISRSGAGTGAMLFPTAILCAQENVASEAIKPESISLTINGKKHALTVDPRITLLDLTREKLGLTGSKKGCDQGQCGACTMLVNGRRINGCLALAVAHDGDEITTIEGIAKGQELHPIQSAFIRCDGFQCGYCTPGQIISAVALMQEGCPQDDAGIREMMSGNICRCGAYNGIVQAIRETRDAAAKA